MNRDPFADVRDKRVCDLNEEQLLRHRELWLREHVGFMPDYHQDHYQVLFKVINQLRAERDGPSELDIDPLTEPSYQLPCVRERRVVEKDPPAEHPLRRRSDWPEVV